MSDTQPMRSSGLFVKLVVAAELAAEGYGSGFIQIVRQRTISPSLYLTEKQYTALKRAARK